MREEQVDKHNHSSLENVWDLQDGDDDGQAGGQN